jgi:hypothetical protein
MRLSEWRSKAPYRDATSTKVIAVLETALGVLGAERDPECWVVWGDDPSARYLVFVPTDSGLLQVNVRVNVPGEGPRAGGKILRWNRIQLGELAVEIQGGHRMLSFQVETQVLHGVDDEADAVATFARMLFAGVDGRPLATAAAPTRAKAASRAAAGRKVTKTVPLLPAPKGPKD